MKKIIISGCLILMLTMTGCAKNYEKYMTSIGETNQAIASTNLKAVEAQEEARGATMKTLTEAMLAAGKTSDSGDDILIALMTMKEMDRPINTQVTPLVPVEAPEKASDIIKSSTPIVLGGIIAGTASSLLRTLLSSVGDRVSVEAGGDVNDSGHIKKQSTTQKDISGDASTETCLDCDKEEAKEEVKEEKGTPPPTCGPTATQVKGTWWYDAAKGCSCDSHALGHC